MKEKQSHWTICLPCQGRGKKSKGLRKKVKLRYQRELEQFNKTKNEGVAPVRPKGHLGTCSNCKGSGLVQSAIKTLVDKENYPELAIVGGGIGGVALALACLHRGIPFTLYERDSGFDVRSQGYGLTLQQGSRAMEELGILYLAGGVTSTRHVVHTTEGNIIGEWGIRNMDKSDLKSSVKRTNVHIARQSLRLALLEQLGGYDAVQWGHKLVDIKDCDGETVDLSFQVKGEMKNAKADIVVTGRKCSAKR